MAQRGHRDQLIDGAIHCLLTKGYARTTARDIARAAHANLGSISYHFGSKDALLKEAMSRLFMDRDRRIAEITLGASGASPLERMTAAFVGVRNFFETHRPLLVAFVEAIAEAEHSPDLRDQLVERYRETRRAAGAMVRASLGDGADDLGTDPEVMGAFLMAAFDGLVVQWLLEPADTPSGEDLVTALAETMAVALEQRPVAGAPLDR